MKHLIDVSELDIQEVKKILEYTAQFAENKNPVLVYPHLENKTLISIFYENSTRTKISFEIAAKKLNMNVINFDISTSSVRKGENEIDTIKTIQAMNVDCIVIRHPNSGIIKQISPHVHCRLINSGDGINQHPTQAILDLFTIYQKLNKFQNLKIGICGDILNSRVARSTIKLHQKLNNHITIAGPPNMIPTENMIDDIKVVDSIQNIITNLDVLILLRLQKERINQKISVPSQKEYNKFYGLNDEINNVIQKQNPNLIIMHPGPVNRNVEMTSTILDDETKHYNLKQVENTIYTRQAILKFLFESDN